MKLSELPTTDKRLQIVCHQGDIDVVNDRDDVATIGPMATVDCADALTVHDWLFLREQPRFVKLFMLVFTKNEELPPWPVKHQGLGTRHVIGLILLSLRALSEGKTPMLVMPESFLHPSAQCGLADLALALTEPQ